MSRTTRCAPLGRVWVCGRSAGRSDSCASKEPPSLAWPDNWQLRGTPCGPISSRACKPHLMTLPVLRGFGCWGVMSMCDITRADAAGAPVSSLASWTTRGEDHPTARLLDLVPGRSGTVHENWLAKRGKDFRAGVRNQRLDPLHVFCWAYVYFFAITWQLSASTASHLQYLLRFDVLCDSESNNPSMWSKVV